MSRTTRYLNLTPDQFDRLKTLGYKLRCHRCGKPLEPRTDIVSKTCNGRPYKTKHYHRHCWEAMFI